MKFALTSDLHRGYDKHTGPILDNFFKDLSRQEFDILLVAGDLGTSKPEHLKECLRSLRENFPDKTILAVLGNHDWWDRHWGRTSFHTALKRRKNWFKRFDIHYLENGPYIIKDVVIYGFDGWYGELDPETYDKDWLPVTIKNDTTHRFFQKRADESLRNILKHHHSGACDELKKIVMTHVPCFPGVKGDPRLNGNPGYAERLLGWPDVVCFGHTHRAIDIEVRGTRLINCGSHNNQPRYKIFEV